MIKVNPLTRNGQENIVAREFCYSPAYLHPGDSRSSTSGKVRYPSVKTKVFKVLGVRFSRSCL